ncbi:MAG: hypothetical protein N2C14_09505 [Planctomycetales bacterium]
MIPPWLHNALLVVASVAVPIGWGWVINCVFNRLRKTDRKPASEDNSTFLDYQI